MNTPEALYTAPCYSCYNKIDTLQFQIFRNIAACYHAETKYKKLTHFCGYELQPIQMRPKMYKAGNLAPAQNRIHHQKGQFKADSAKKHMKGKWNFGIILISGHIQGGAVMA